MHFTAGTSSVAPFLDGIERHRDERGLALLARAGEVLVGELDTAARLRRLARLLVPNLADVACVYVTGDHGKLELVESWALDTAQRTLAEARAARWAAAKDAPPVVARVLRTGRAELVEVTDAHLVAASQDPEDLEVLRRFGAGSWICAPISARGRTLGAITLVRASTADAPARLHDTWDLALAEEIARRAAVAVENARLFELAQRERRRAEEALRLKDEFVANLGHELRTPLTAILGWTRILRTRAVPDATRARALEVIERNALAQARLVEDLLDVSRILAGELALERRPVDLAPSSRPRSVPPDPPPRPAASTSSPGSTPPQRGSPETETDWSRSSPTCSPTLSSSPPQAAQSRSASSRTAPRRRWPSPTPGRASTPTSSPTSSIASARPTAVSRAPTGASASASPSPAGWSTSTTARWKRRARARGRGRRSRFARALDPRRPLPSALVPAPASWTKSASISTASAR